MTDGRTPPAPWHARLHAALMPDYNRPATVYWWLVTPAGLLLLLGCLLHVVLTLSGLSVLQVAAGLLLAIGAGLFPLRIPGTRVSLGTGEVVIFLVLLMHGPAAAVVLAGAEAAVGSYRTSKRWTSRLGSPAMASLALFAAGTLHGAGRDALAQRGFDGPASLLGLALVTGLVYFVLSAVLIGGTARLRRGQHLLQMSDLFGAFRWAGLAYAGSMFVATLLFLVVLQAGPAVLWVTVPLVAMLLLVLHYYFLQQEAQEAMRKALADIARREEAGKVREAEAESRHERELRMSERRFHGAFTNAAIGMVLLDLDGHVLEANESMARLLGRQTEVLMGMPFAAVLHPDDRGVFVAALSRANDVHFEPFDRDLRLLDASGRVLPAHVHCGFFSGPARRRTDRPGRPCLMLQVLSRTPPARENPAGPP